MKKNWFLLVALVILSLGVVSGAEINSAYNWLNLERSNDGSYNSDVIETSASILALSEAGLDFQPSVDWLLTQKDSEGCFPVGDCKVKDTAYALLALDKVGENTDDIVSWLDGAQKSAPSSGKWWLQVVSDSDGSCELKYLDSSDSEVVQVIQIVDKKFPQCGDNNWFDLKECVNGKPLNKQPKVSFEVSCDSLSSSIISLIYQSGDNYYLLEESKSISSTITPDTGCWAEGVTGTCKTDSTLYASWALKEVKGSTPAITWLRDNYKRSDTNHNALLLLITEKNSYFRELESLQQTSGSWGDSVFRTSLASLAIISTNPLSDTLTSSISWLDGKQKADGSWDSNVLDSAITLYAAYSGFTPTCGDNVCRSEDGEDSSSCPADCGGGTSSVGGSQDLEICDDNFDNDGDGYSDCEDVDCFGDPVCALDVEICDDLIDNDEDNFIDCEDLDCSSDPACSVSDVTIVDDEEEGSSVWFWIILVLILLMIGGLLFYLKKKGFFKRRKKGERPAPIPPLILPKRAPPRRTVVPKAKPKKKEDELERSIREARKLMGLK